MILVIKFYMKERSDRVVLISPGQSLSTEVICKSDITFFGAWSFYAK